MGPSVLFLDEQEILDHAMKQDTLCEIAGVRARKWGATSMVTYANALAVPRTDPLAAKDNPQLLQPFVCRCRLASAGLGGRKNRQFSVRHDCGPQETEYFALATTSCFAEKNCGCVTKPLYYAKVSVTKPLYIRRFRTKLFFIFWSETALYNTVSYPKPFAHKAVFMQNTAMAHPKMFQLVHKNSCLS